jgi:hypothetical protein
MEHFVLKALLVKKVFFHSFRLCLQLWHSSNWGEEFHFDLQLFSISLDKNIHPEKDQGLGRGH